MGSDFDVKGASRTLVVHYDGTRWTQVSSPGPGIGSELFSVTCFFSMGCQAVGSQDAPTGQPLILTYTSTGWQIFAPSVAGSSGGWALFRDIAFGSSTFSLAVGVMSTASGVSSSQISQEIFAPTSGG